MKLSIEAFCLFMLISSLGLSQEREKPRANYFLFAAPGARHDTGSLTFEVGGGAEGYVYKGLGFGFDAGGMRVSSTTGVESWAAVVTLNSLYNFNTHDKSKISPLVIAGWSLMGKSDVLNGYNFGGGLQYWLTERVGLRFEFRDHVFTGIRNHHYPQGRIGIVFRR